MRTVEQLKGLKTGELIRQKDDLLLGMQRGGSVAQDRMIIENMNKVLATRGIPDDMTHDDYTEKYGILGRAGALGRGLVHMFGSKSVQGNNGPEYNENTHD